MSCLTPRTSRCLGALMLVAAVLLGVPGCSRQPAVQDQLAELERAFPGAAAGGAVSGPAAYVAVALAAARTNNYATAIIALNTVMRLPGATPQQLLAVENARQTLNADLLARAAKGDPQAKAALATIEKTLSQ